MEPEPEPRQRQPRAPELELSSRSSPQKGRQIQRKLRLPQPGHGASARSLPRGIPLATVSLDFLQLQLRQLRLLRGSNHET